MSLESYSPFGLQDVFTVSPPIPPSDLIGLVERLHNVPRFVDEKYPPGIFSDNDKDHETRLVIYANLGMIKGVNKNRLNRMLWIHDIPELETGDVVSPKKDSDQKVAKRLEDAERIAASNLLSADDCAILEEFNSSGNFIRGKTDGFEGISVEGLVANVLDKIDGNMFFHFTLAKWVLAGDGERVIPSVAALEFTFKQRNQFIQALEKVKMLFPDAVIGCQFLLDYQIEYLIEVWKSVPEQKQPRMIRNQLQGLEVKGW